METDSNHRDTIDDDLALPDWIRSGFVEMGRRQRRTSQKGQANREITNAITYRYTFGDDRDSITY